MAIIQSSVEQPLIQRLAIGSDKTEGQLIGQILALLFDLGESKSLYNCLTSLNTTLTEATKKIATEPSSISSL